MRETLDRVLDDLGRRLAELRHDRNWTQQQAADRVDMLLRDYQAIEGGRRSISLRTALALAQALDVPLRTLFDAPVSRSKRKPGRPAAAAVERGAMELKPKSPPKKTAREVTRSGRRR